MTFFSVLFGLIVAAIAAVLFSTVVPPAAAFVLATIFLAVELAGSSRGGAIKAALRVDAVLIAWPVAALLLDLIGVPGRSVRITLAAGIAAVFAGIAAGRSSGEDDTRMRVLIASALITAYALLRALVQPIIDPYALAAGALAAAVPLGVVAAGGVVLPDQHRYITGLAAGMAACAGVALAATTYLHARF
jgi:hypothetical protein